MLYVNLSQVKASFHAKFGQARKKWQQGSQVAASMCVEIRNDFTKETKEVRKAKPQSPSLKKYYNNCFVTPPIKRVPLLVSAHSLLVSRLDSKVQ